MEDNNSDNKGYAALRVNVKHDEQGNKDEKLNSIILEYLRKWQCPTETYNGRMGISAHVPSWIEDLDNDNCCPRFSEKEINFINSKINNNKIIPVLEYAPDAFSFHSKAVWWIIPFCIWKNDVASWLFVDKNGIYAPHPEDEDVTHIVAWENLLEMNFSRDEDEVETLEMSFEGGSLTFEEFVPANSGSYLSVLFSIYEIRKKTIEASAGQPIWPEGAGGEGFKAFASPVDLLSENKWKNPHRPNS